MSPRKEKHVTEVAPTAVLLVGISGSGKTVLAKVLAARGVTRLWVDEEVHRRHGRYGVDYPEHEYFEREGPTVEDVRADSSCASKLGKTSFWTTACGCGASARSGPRRWKQSADGRSSCTSPLSVASCCDAWPIPTSVRTPTPLPASPEALDDFFARFEPPMPDGGTLIYTGDADAVYEALRS